MSYKIDLGKAVMQIVVKRCSGTDREYAYVYVPGKLSVYGKKDIMDILRFEKALESLAKQFKPAKMSGDDFEKEVKLALKLVPLDKNDEVVEQLNSDQIQDKYAHLKEDADIIFEEEIPGKEQRVGGNKVLREEVMEDIEENEENNASVKSPNDEKTALDASKNKDENSQGGSGQDSDVGSAENQISGNHTLFPEWQKVLDWVAGKESRAVVCSEVPKNSKPEDCATFFRQYDAEDWKRNPGGFKSVCSYTVIFKTVEAATEFLNLAKVMYGNVELDRQTQRDYHTLNKMGKRNVLLVSAQRHLRRLHEFVTTKTGLLSDSVPSAQMVLVSSFSRQTTHSQVRQFVSDEENKFKDISGIFRIEDNMEENKGSENRKFLQRYVFLFSSVQSAEMFVQSKLDFGNTRLRATLFRDLEKHLNVLDQVKNFIDDGEDAEASPKQRAVVLGHNPELDPTDEFEAKLRKHLKSVRGMFLCASSCIVGGQNKYIVTFKNVMAARSATKSENIESEAFKSRLLIYSLDEYLRIRERLMMIKRRTNPKLLDSSCNNYYECFKVEDESILKIKILKYKCSSTQTTITVKHQIRSGDRMQLLGLAPGEFDDLVICKFSKGKVHGLKGERIPKTKEILAYMKDNHPGYLKVHEFKKGLFFIRFENSERAEAFHDLPYCYYMEYPVERFRIWDYLGDNTMASLYRHEITPHLYPERDKFISGAYVGIDVIGFKHMEDSEKKATEDKMMMKMKDVPVRKLMWVGETENPVLRIIIHEEVEVVVKQIKVFMNDPDRNKLQFLLYKESQENLEKRKREESRKRPCSESDPVSSKRR